MKLEDIKAALKDADNADEMFAFLDEMKKTSDDNIALVDSSKAKIEELSTNNQQLLKSMSELKAKNYDLLMAQDAGKNTDANSEGDEITLDSLFKE